MFRAKKLAVVAQSKNLVPVRIPAAKVASPACKCRTCGCPFAELYGECKDLIPLQFHGFDQPHGIPSVMSGLPSEIAQASIVIIAAILHIKSEPVLRDDIPCKTIGHPIVSTVSAWFSII